MHFKEQQMLTSRDNDEKVTRQKTTTTNQVSEPEKNQGEQGTKLQRHWK